MRRRGIGRIAGMMYVLRVLSSQNQSALARAGEEPVCSTFIAKNFRDGFGGGFGPSVRSYPRASEHPREVMAASIHLSPFLVTAHRVVDTSDCLLDPRRH